MARRILTNLQDCCLMRGLCPSRRLEYFYRGFSCDVFVTRLSSYTTVDELRDGFSPFGNVLQARLIKDQRTKRPKGFGFVKYETTVEAQKAMKAMDGRIFGGRLIFVEIAKTRLEDTDDS